MIPNPLALIAEVTHRCPLHCVYCSNPLELAGTQVGTLDRRVDQRLPAVRQTRHAARALHRRRTAGSHRSDRTDLLPRAPRDSTPTSSLQASDSTSSDCRRSCHAGLDHIQISFQDSREEAANWIAGAKAHAHKIELSRAIRRHKIAFTVNLVVHRQNLDHLEEMIAFIEQLNPERVEIAHTQYYGWALANRAALLPTHAQLERAVAIVAEAERRLAGRIRIDSVVPDYYAKYPKACMGGWGRRLMLINPAGKVLPCHAAEVLPGLSFENVREKTLEWIWQESPSFRRFRGEDWMPEPCRSCDRRAEDFGGCRCQAFLLAGDATVTDPACSLAPSHAIVEAAVREANSGATWRGLLRHRRSCNCRSRPRICGVTARMPSSRVAVGNVVRGSLAILTIRLR